MVCNFLFADVLDLNTALQNTYRACVDIDAELYEMKVLAGINTAITGVGTGLGIGAAATGFAKAKTDKRIEDIERLLNEIKQKTKDLPPAELTFQDIQNLSTDFDKSYDSAVSKIQKQKELQQNKDELTTKSKKLGDWRTGLLIGNTATNVAGAIIANKNKINGDLQSKIDNCIANVKSLNDAILSAKISGDDISEAENIYNACREYEFVDLSPINKRATGATISSSVGAVASGIGSITSGMANSDKIRDDDSDTGKAKERNLNTTSNVLAVGGTIASATATVFNASQIATIKKIAKVSENCTRVLK